LRTAIGAFRSEDADPDRPDTWVVRLLVEKEAEAFVGPFVLDRSHPLTEGLSLQGVVWGAGPGKSLPGLPVVLAGNVPLLTDAAYRDFDPDVHLMALAPGDLLAVPATGAYTASMASNYNLLPRPAAVMVSNGEARLVQRRETVEDVLARDV